MANIKDSRAAQASMLMLMLSWASSVIAAPKASETPKPAPAKSAVTTVPVVKNISVYEIVPAESMVTIRIGHSVIGRFDSTGKNALTGKISIDADGPLTASRLEFKPESLDSVVPLRETHMKNEYFEVQKFPLIALLDGTIDKIATQSDKRENFKGTLVVKDVNVGVSGTSDLKIDNDFLKGTVEFDTKISNFPMKAPYYKGVGVEDNVHLIIKIFAKPDLNTDDLPQF